MKRERIKELHDLFLEFSPLLHENFLALFKKNDDIEPKCYKNQVRSMFIIQRRQRVTASELGRCLDLEKGSLTSLVDSLVDLGLVRREPDQDDRRKVWLVLTAAGEKYLVRKSQAHEGHFIELFEKLSAEEIEGAITNMKALIKTLKKL